MIISVVLLLCVVCLSAQTPIWQWAVSVGAEQNDRASSIVTDDQGNIYATGAFRGTVEFGETTLTSFGDYENEDVYVAKLSSDGTFLWAVQAGGELWDSGCDIAVDDSSNVYITGQYQETASFGNTTLEISSRGLFVAKLDSNGNWLWAKTAGGTGVSVGLGIALDSESNIDLTGSFWGPVTFGPITLTEYGNYDIFAAKLTNNGGWLWAVSAGGVDYDFGEDIAIDEENNIYLTGIFIETATFGPLLLTNASYTEIFAAKLDSLGNFLWAVKAGGPGIDWGVGIDIDTNSNVYLTGMFFGDATFGSTTFTSNGSDEIYIAKLDNDGNWLWTVRAGGLDDDQGYGIDVVGSDEIYLVGRYSETASFGNFTLTSSSIYDFSNVFVAKLDGNGNWFWATSCGGPDYDTGVEIATDAAGNVSVTGDFAGEATFGFTTIYGHGFHNADDIFVASLCQVVPVSDDLAPGASDHTSLTDIYPNPFRRGDSAIIKANISDTGGGTLSVFNLRGQCVARHVLTAGEQQISLDSRDLASGIYLCQLRTASDCETRKLVLLR
jgi:hypothetical protein